MRSFRVLSHSESRGGFRIFFRRGCTRLLLYFNTNKTHSFFFFCRTPVVLENRRSSQGGGVHTPCTLPLDPPLERSKQWPKWSLNLSFWNIVSVFLAFFRTTSLIFSFTLRSADNNLKCFLQPSLHVVDNC